jgi:hypothetical protein
MPFDKKVVIELVYRNTGNSNNRHAHIKIYYTKNKRTPETEGRFYTCWAGNAQPAIGSPHVLLNTRGKGHFVATLLQAQALHAGMTYFFEGDDSTAVDGQPRIHGTGSEDYFNGGWYALPDRWDSKLSLPLYGCLDYNLPFSRTGGYRLYLTDKISFEGSIYQSIEHGPQGNNIPASYTSLCFYYCSTPPAGIIQPTNELTSVRTPDTLMVYPQLMDVNLRGSISVKSLWAYDTGGESFVFTVDDQSGLGISLNNIPNGHYKLFMDVVKYPEGCEFSLWQRQTQLSGWLPTGSTAKERVKQLYAGDIAITDLQKTVTLQFKTTGTGKNLFLNRMVLVRE